MALSALPPIGKSIELDDGTRYAYAYAEPATFFQPTFLLHGFPSSSYN
jgi:soluble epoxide hydrolase/lipid-phosphate phosphatase